MVLLSPANKLPGMANRRFCLPLFLVSNCLFTLIQADAAADLITDLPGLTFDPGFKQYSGFLHTPSGNNLHYWLVESQNNPATDPLVLWLNGGPGCSSLGGFFKELGPFRVNQDGVTLFENIYSWNKGANVVFLESPRDVGFSYRDPDAAPNTTYNDDLSAEDNADALVEFLERFPEYKGRPFFITGESYAGVYIPTLLNVLVKRIIAGTIIDMNLVGAAIGNGYLNVVDQFNSLIGMLYWRGMLGMDQFDALKVCCPEMAGKPLAYCNFSNFVEWPSNDPKKYSDSVMNACAQNIATYSYGNPLNDAYNSYQDCYMDDVTPLSLKALKSAKMKVFIDPVAPGAYVNEGARINIGSTDAQYGFPCWVNQMIQKYLNLPAVRSAIHIPPFVPTWRRCNYKVNSRYVQQYYDLTPFFVSIAETGYPLRVLLYNGDVDTVCEFLGVEWFTMNLVNQLEMNSSRRKEWTFQESTKFQPQLGGYRQNFTDGTLNIDFLTVKGAGHFVPLDRGGPALQMLTNFINENDYSTALFWNTTPKATHPQYQPKPPKQPTRKELDRIWNLPGLTYTPNFKQYSGYLHGVPGDYLYYWFVESQNKPETDPLVLWLNGGPGCSSIGGLFSENGPFHPNPDGTTLFENIYSWNKLANVLYLETPRNVGFSYQNTSINPDPTYNDLKTARGSFLALMDFLTVYPEYVGRPFYITGESYAGIYIPTLTSYAIDQILAGNGNGLNLKGIAIGNGVLSKIDLLSSLMSMLYYRGIYGHDLYKELMDCCPDKTQPAAYCDFSQFVHWKGHFIASPKNVSSICDMMILYFGSYYIWVYGDRQDVYDLYEDGYRQLGGAAASASNPRELILSLLKELKMDFEPQNLRKLSKIPDFRISSEIPNLKTFSELLQAPNQMDASLYSDRRSRINYKSTDGKGNFYWYQQAATPKYLNLPDVRAALHIPSFVPVWSGCNYTINRNYYQQWDDTTPLFKHFFNSGYPLRILIYNGDTDLACGFLGDEWFTEKLASITGMSVIRPRVEWTYQSQTAGFWKQFQTPIGTFDLVTVKGAGHFVPLDRPGPALQMITNFLSDAGYSTPLPFSVGLSPLKKQYVIQKQIAAAPNTTSNRVKRSSYAAQIKEGTKEDDLISNLNGLTFTPTFKQYSGFLSARENAKLNYWLIEANQNASQLPLIVWIGDGPGCSSIYEALISIGPYRVKAEGTLLYQNTYSWNQAANLLFLEATPGSGFSPADTQTYDDDMVVSGLQAALNAFFKRFTEYENRNFYIFGKGYGAIYALNLASKFQNAAVKLTGVGIANGLLSYNRIINTAANVMYFSGMLGKSEWDKLVPCCMKANGEYDEDCNLAQYVTVDSHGDISANSYTNATLQRCANLVVQYTQTTLRDRLSPTGRWYRSCYEGMIPVDPKIQHRKKRQAGHLSGLPLTNTYPFINQPDRTNYRSTDAFASYPCFMDYATSLYFNLPATQKSMHIPSNSYWQKCNPSVSYTRKYFDMTPFFKELLKKPLKMIVFDGDSHLQNNFLANELFINTWAQNNNLKRSHKTFFMINSTRIPWTYQKSAKYFPQFAGFIETYYSGNENTPTFKLDLLTVKGAGDHIALDRPAPALQMISNYLSSTTANLKSYSKIVPVQPIQPLSAPYTPPTVPQVSRMDADKIYDLPGLTFALDFKQYSGYLKAESSGAYLHYWLVESQVNPATDPLIIWFNGGPGCSSLAGLLSENGPFRANSDGRTLFENVFSWNKLANVLYIESPYDVGFSYRVPQRGVRFQWNDTRTANDAYMAIKDFFTIFPQYAANDLYISGESYAGIYVPTLTDLLIQKIQQNNEKFNLKGIIVGNGYLSAIQDIRSLPSYMYFHGIYGKQAWDSLMSCCPNNDGREPISACNFDDYVELRWDGRVVVRPNVNQTCGRLVVELAFTRVWNTMNDVYNLYQDCYQQTQPNFAFASDQHRRQTLKLLMENNQAKLRPNMGIAYMKAMPWGIYTYSTDHLGGFPCFMMHSVTKYLNQPDVRDALHVPDYVQRWAVCSEQVSNAYKKEYNDTTSIFQSIFRSGYPLRVLIYSGDVDTACSIFESEWFIEAFAKMNNMTASEYIPWLYQISPQFSPQIGGYQKHFNMNNLAIGLVTVKGAGHMVPTDRAGPMLQLLTNFIRNQNYNNASPFSFERKPLLPAYQPA